MTLFDQLIAGNVTQAITQVYTDPLGSVFYAGLWLVIMLMVYVRTQSPDLLIMMNLIFLGTAVWILPAAAMPILIFILALALASILYRSFIGE